MDTSPLPTGPSKNQRAAIPLLFTARWLASLKPKTTPYKFAETADADDPTQPAKRGMGRFIVRVQPDGRKEFFFRYRMNGGDRGGTGASACSRTASVAGSARTSLTARSITPAAGQGSATW